VTSGTNWTRSSNGSRCFRAVAPQRYRTIFEQWSKQPTIPGDYEFLIPVAPTITEEQLKQVQYNTGDLYLGKDNPPRITFVRDARAALFHARASIVASGTATVQALTIGNPFVVVYRVSPLTYAILKRMIRYPAEIPPHPTPTAISPSPCPT